MPRFTELRDHRGGLPTLTVAGAQQRQPLSPLQRNAA
jgi:hypothetical protein